MATTTNPYKRFQQLLGSQSKQIAEVLVTYSDGTSLVETRSGKQFVVRGNDIPAGSKAWLVDGVIISEAPNMPSYSVTV